jgi:hypothetical protein
MSTYISQHAQGAEIRVLKLQDYRMQQQMAELQDSEWGDAGRTAEAPRQG